MKNLKTILLAGSIAALCLKIDHHHPVLADEREENPKAIIVYLDPSDNDLPPDLDLPDLRPDLVPVTPPAPQKPASIPASTQPSTKPTTKPATLPTTNPTDPDKKTEAQKKLEDLIRESQKRAPLNKEHQRIYKQVLKDQTEFLQRMDEFLKTKFDVQDENAHPEFNAIRARIVKLVFDAPDEKFYFERIFLINDVWLSHQDQIERFASLDHALRDRWLELEAKRKRIRQIITGTSAVVGTILGGYLSYRVSMKVFPIASDEKGLASLAKVGGRFVMVIVGAGVGMTVGNYVGFLGSDALLQHQRDYINPVDGSEDLREILDIIKEKGHFLEAKKDF